MLFLLLLLLSNRPLLLLWILLIVETCTYEVAWIQNGPPQFRSLTLWLFFGTHNQNYCLFSLSKIWIYHICNTSSILNQTILNISSEFYYTLRQRFHVTKGYIYVPRLWFALWFIYSENLQVDLVLVIGPNTTGSCPPTFLNRVICELASPCSVKGRPELQWPAPIRGIFTENTL